MMDLSYDVLAGLNILCLFRFYPGFSTGFDPDQDQSASVSSRPGRLEQYRFGCHNYRQSPEHAYRTGRPAGIHKFLFLVRFLDSGRPVEWYTLAVSSTFAGNLIIVGSIANLIVIEQAANFGIQVTFREHATVGVPVTLFSLAVLVFWIDLT
jgi:hypothetical protein